MMKLPPLNNVLVLLLAPLLASAAVNAVPPQAPTAINAPNPSVDIEKLSRAECTKAKLAVPRRIVCGDTEGKAAVEPTKFIGLPRAMLPAAPLAVPQAAPAAAPTTVPPVLPVIAPPVSTPVLAISPLAASTLSSPALAPQRPISIAPEIEKRARGSVLVAQPIAQAMGAAPTLAVAPALSSTFTPAPAPSRPQAFVNLAIAASSGAVPIDAAPHKSTFEKVAVLNANVAANPAVTTPRPTPKPPPAFEAAQLVIYWSNAGEAAIGMAVLAREFKLNPASENQLPNLGGVIATFKVASQREAERVKTLLTTRYPTWRIDFQARYLPHQSTAPPASSAPLAMLNRLKPRQFLAEKINYSTPALDAGAGIRIGIVDTAVEPNSALKANALVQRSFLNIGEIPASTVHGTALAALMVGHDVSNDFNGISPGAVLYVAGIMRLQGGGGGGFGGSGGISNANGAASNTATLVRALDWLLGERVQVINLSLGGVGDRIMEEVIARIVRARVVVVSAAGNKGEDAAPSYPAAYPGVIAVTASDANDRIYAQANRGAYVAITAPGVDVWTPNNQGGQYVTGTSFAAAIVSGAVTVMLWRDVRLDPSEIRQRLCQHARDLGGAGPDATFGCGLIQLEPTLVAIPKRNASVGADAT